jgi:hypothetical protein
MSNRFTILWTSTSSKPIAFMSSGTYGRGTADSRRSCH